MLPAFEPRPLFPDSPAIDAGNPALDPSLFDQRGSGFSRVLDGTGDGQARSDIGAVEAPGSDINPPSNLIEGTNQRDTLLGTNGADTIKGFKAKDFLKGKNGNDILEGGSGNDRIIAGKGDDILGGGQGQDFLKGGRGRDTFACELMKAKTSLQTLKWVKIYSTYLLSLQTPDTTVPHPSTSTFG